MTARRRQAEYRWQANSLWLVPMICIAAGAAAEAITLAIDGAVGYDRLPSSVLGTPTAVQTILSTAASAMLTLTTIVLTVLTLGVQLAMQQFSPRIVRALLSDRRSQLAHGLFAATFLYCMVAVAKVNDKGSAGSQVPSLTVVFAYLLLLASLVVLVLYVHHAGQSLRVAGLIDVVGDNLQAELDRSFPIEASPRMAAGTVTAREAGVVVMIDAEGLVEQARRSDDCLEMLVAVGDFVPRDAPVVRSRGGARLDPEAVRGMVRLDNERSHVGDAAYGFRKLVDIVERSIASNPYNDPATAVQAIHRLHDGVRQLCFREIPSGRHEDSDGVLRLLTRELAWHGYVTLAFEEVVTLGSSSPLVARRLLAALDDLIAVAPSERRPPLEAQRRRLLSSTEEPGVAVEPDVQGLGSGHDLTDTPR
jgi:uncharacterized membrane protein